MSMEDVLGIVMGGGVGSRLYPLTRDRTKPAVPFAGKYRLIDIPMGNCFNAGIDKIAILTQFNSVSLHRHIHRDDGFHAACSLVEARFAAYRKRDPPEPTPVQPLF